MSEARTSELIYPDMWPCKKLRAVGTISKDCAYPNCDCGQRERASEKHSDIELASAWDDPTVLMLPILPKYEP